MMTAYSTFKRLILFDLQRAYRRFAVDLPHFDRLHRGLPRASAANDRPTQLGDRPTDEATAHPGEKTRVLRIPPRHFFIYAVLGLRSWGMGPGFFITSEREW